jgi:hypothetical protein
MKFGVEKMKKDEVPNDVIVHAPLNVLDGPNAGEIDLDLTGVDPLRINEVRRRVEVVKSYLEVPQPDENDRRRHAGMLGLSVNQFMALVRAWREHGRAVAMSGAGAARGTPRASVPRSLPERSKQVARSAILSLAPDTSLAGAVRTVTARCAALGLQAPSKSTIWNMMMALRRDSPVQSGAGSIVIARCHAKLPVELEGHVFFPSLTLATDTGSGIISAVSVGYGEVEMPTIARDLLGQSPLTPIQAGRDVAAKGDFRGCRLIKPSAARTATARVLGRGFGSIDLIYQISRSIDPKSVLRARKDTPLQVADAQRLICEQLTKHNAGRQSPPPHVSWHA